MKRKKWVIAFLAVIMSLTTLIAIAACKPEQTEAPTKEEGPETGVYYYDAGTEEYQIALNSGDAFTFLVMGENKTGTYTLTGETLELDFARAEDTDLTATLSGDVLTLTYEDVSMRFLKKIAYTVTFDAQEGSAVAAETVMNGKTVAKPADPVREGYVFVGWYTDAEHTMPFLFGTQPVTSDVTLYAYWLAKAVGTKEYTVDFDLGYEGEAPAAVETIAGCVVDLPVPEREGYTFLGWYVSAYDDAARLTYEYTAGTALRENTTLYALWREEGAAGLAAPEVSVTSTGVTWEAVSGAKVYTVSVSGPNGYERTYSDLQTTSQAVDFSVLEAGDYEVTVTASAATSVAGDANAVTTERSYKNKALAGVSFFTVVEPSALVFEGVANAEAYYLTIDCGNAAHDHDRIALGTATNYNFVNCPMQEGGIRFTVTAEAEGYAPSVSKEFVYNRELARVSGLVYDAETETVYWDAVADAMSYVVSVSCGDAAHATEPKDIGNVTSYSIKDCAAGEVVFSIYPRTKGYNSPVATTLTVEKATLAAPSGMRVNGSELTWNAVSGATGYTVRINGTEYRADGNTFDLTSYAAAGEELKIAVRAEGSASSQWSDEQTMQYLAMSGALHYGGSVLTWNAVVGATYYEVRVNDGEWTRYGADVTSAEVELTQAGENRLYVRFGDTQGLPSTEEAETTAYAYTIEFDVRGGSAAVAPLYVAYGDKVTLPVPESAAYDFAGWYNVPGGAQSNGAEYTDTVFTERSDVLVYASWHGKTFTVTYNADLGAVSSATAEVVYGEAFKLEVPANTDERDARYAFVGWYTGADGEGKRYTDEAGNSVRNWGDAADTTLYARWAEVLTFVPTTGQAGEPAYSVQAGPEIEAVSKVRVPATYKASGTNDEYYVASILSGAFQNCTTLEEIDIPNSIQIVGATSLDDAAGAFAGCDNLMNVNVYAVEGTHEVVFSSVDGVLLRVTQASLARIAYFPAARTGIYYVPDVVEEIPTRTFANTGITAVVIPKEVLYIRQTAFYNCDELETVVFEEGGSDSQALLIESYAFQSCDRLANITLPARLGEVESFSDVFYGCNALANVFVEEGNGFYSSVDGLICDALGTTVLFCPYGRSGSYTMPSTVTAIGESAFAERNRLTEIVIGAYVESIGAHAFEGCTNLTSVTFLGSAVANATTIGNYAFYNCVNLATVTFEENCAVESFGEYSFAYCEDLGEILIPTTTKSIGAYAFQSCVSLGSLTFEGGEEELAIGDYAFSECASLTEVNLMAAVADFNFYRVFNGCNYIESVNVDDANKYFADIDGVLYNKTLTEVVYYPRVRSEETYALPDTVSVIREGAFADNAQLTSFEIGANVTTIGDYAFYNDSGMETLTVQGGTLPLTLGEYAFAGCSGLTALALPDRTTEIGAYAFYAASGVMRIALGTGDLSDSALASIGSYAFGQNGIEEIVIPDSVSSIGANAFDSCQSLIRAELPASMTVVGTALFSNCPALSEVEIPEGVTEIGDEAFVDATALSEFTLPSTLKVIGEAAFENTGVVHLTIPASVTTIKDDAFLDCLNLETLTFEEGSEPLTIGADAFDGCIALTSASFSSNVSVIDDYAFSGCTALKNITFATNAEGKSMLTTIGQRTFLNCGFEEVVLPEGLTTITSNAFYAGTDAGRNLRKVVIPSTVTSIGSSAFYNQYHLETVIFTGGTADLTIATTVFMNCTSLKSIVFPANLVSIDTRSIQGCTALTSIGVSEDNATYVSADGALYTRDAETGAASSLVLFPIGKTGSFVLPEGTTMVENYLFQKSQLTSLTLPDTVTSIGNYAFQNSTIQSITLSEGLTSIGTYAFQNVPIKSLVLPASLTDIGNYAFDGSSLEAITLPAAVKSVGYYAFQNCDDLRTVTFEEGFNAEFPIHSRSNNASYPIDGNYTFANSGVTTINLAASMTEIADGMFFQCEDLTAINFAENGKLARIGSYAFGAANTSSAYPKITSIEIPGSVTEIAGGAFNNWQNLTSVTFEEGTQPLVFGDGNGYSNFSVSRNYTNYGVFGYCTALTSITLPARLTTVGRFTFTGCSSLKTIDFEKNADGQYGVTEIDYGAFRETAIESFVVPDTVTTLAYNSTYTNNTFARCLSLKSVTLPVGFTAANDCEINWRMFYGSSALEAVNVAEGNPDYYSIDGVVFDRDDELVYFPIGKDVGETYTVPDGTASIGADSFYHYNRAGSSTAHAVPDYAGISGIIIPASVSFVGDSALQVPALETIVFTEPASAGEGADTLTIDDSAFSMYYSTSSALSGSSLKSVTLPSRLTELGNEVFRGNSQLTSVTIPANVESMGYGVFAGCSALSSVTFEEGSKLTTFGSTSSSSRSIFSGCTSLTSVVLPDSVESLPRYAFYGCSALTEVVLPKSLEIINGNAFRNCAGITEIDLERCTSLESIGADAFSGCTGLTSISLPMSVTEIGDSAFENCTALAEVEMLPTLVTIGDSAFSGCASLETFTVYGSVTSIGQSAFAGCSKLDLKVDDNNTSFAISENGGILYDSMQTVAVSVYGNLSGEVVIPGTVTSIPDGMFAGSAVTKVTLPASITEIADNMFNGCVNLTEVVMLGRVTSIGEYAFAGSGLEKITIGRFVTYIGEGAFQDCANLTDVTFEARGSESLQIDDYAFQNCTSLKKVDLPVRLRNPDTASYTAGLGLYAFDGCTALQTVTFSVRGGEMLTGYLSLGNYAFRNTGLTSFEMPSYAGYRSQSLAAIGYYTFDGCTALKSFTFNSTRQSYYYVNSYAFRNCTALEEVNNIPSNLYLSSTSGVFQNCTSLKEIALPAYFPAGTRCFSGCTSLQTVTLYETSNVVPYLGQYMFENCTALTTVNLPSTMYNIGAYAFSGCTALETIELPAALQYLNDCAFDGCTSLKSIEVEDGNLKFSSVDGNLYTADGATLLRYAPGKTATEFTVPSTVTTIAIGAFDSCTALTNVVLPASVTTVEAGAFDGWTAAQTITVPFASNAVPSGFASGWNAAATVVYATAAATADGKSLLA